MHLALAEALVILRGSDVVVWHPMFEHVIHGPGDLVCGGDQGLCGPKPSFQAPLERAKRAVRADDRLGGHAEGLRGTVAMLHGAALQHLATGEVIFGSQASPGAEVFVIRPLTHVGADRGPYGLRKGIAHAVHGYEIHTSEAQDMGAGVPLRGILAVRVGLATRWYGGACGHRRLGGGLEVGLEHGKGVLDLGVARPELRRVAIEQCQRLCEDKEMLRAPGACQRHGDLVRILLAAVVAQGSQVLRVTLAGDHGTEDPLPSVTRDLTKRLRPLDIHLHQRLRHVEDMGGAMLKELGAMAPQRTERHEVGGRTTRGREQPVTVAGLDPLTVQDVTLAPGNAFDGLGADEAALEAAGFQCLKQRNPLDARGCHSDRLDATIHKPIGQRLESSGGSAKGAHALLVIAVGHTRHDLMRANVDARSVWVHLAHALERTGVALRGSSTIALTQFAHGILRSRTKRGRAQSRSITCGQ